jgi:hypothetical protein
MRKKRRHIAMSLPFFFTTFLGSISAHAALDISSDTSFWTAVTYAHSSETPEDQQTGLEGSDLVGDINHPTFYTQFDDAGTTNLTDGTLGFRVRLKEAKNEAKMTFDYNLLVGMDANTDGTLDLFVGVDNNPNGTGFLAIWNPGSGSNTTPSTISIDTTPQATYLETVTNYHFGLVDLTIDPDAQTLDVDNGGNTDVFLSFAFNFEHILTHLANLNIHINEETPINYLVATALQANNILDINGTDGSIDSTETFVDIGAVSGETTPSGDTVPEPAAIGLIAFGGAGMIAAKRIRASYY